MMEALMAHRTKLQLIKRKNSEQWYVNFPAQVAQVMDFQRGEEVEWELIDRTQLLLNRPEAPAPPVVKKKRLE
jgi:hypothetical protein